MEHYFQRQVFPVLTPVAVDPSHPFPILSNCTIEIAVTLQKKGKKKNLRALVEVPEVLPRFIQIKCLSKTDKAAYILLEDLILAHIDQLFSGCKIIDAFVFRMTRDMDFAIDGVPVGYGQLTSILGGAAPNDPVRHITGTLADGSFINNDFYVGGNATVVLIPEPATLFLLGLGAIKLRRKR